MKNNRQKILETALKLFNEHGFSKISTNHICDEISISPGNLYFHFRNKEEIIVELLRQMIDQWDALEHPKIPSKENIFLMYERVFYFLWEYRFIHREITLLNQQMDRFRKIFIEVQDRRLKEIKKFIQENMAAGIFKELNNNETDRLANIIWFFALYWIPFLESSGKNITKTAVKESLASLNQIIAPYFEKRA